VEASYFVQEALDGFVSAVEAELLFKALSLARATGRVMALTPEEKIVQSIAQKAMS
jgi:hypothetical protein